MLTTTTTTITNTTGNVLLLKCHQIQISMKNLPLTISVYNAVLLNPLDISVSLLHLLPIDVCIYSKLYVENFPPRKNQEKGNQSVNYHQSHMNGWWSSSTLFAYFIQKFLTIVRVTHLADPIVVRFLVILLHIGLLTLVLHSGWRSDGGGVGSDCLLVTWTPPSR